MKKPQGSPEPPSGPRVLRPRVPQPAPASVSPVGVWRAFHPAWQAPLTILENGTFKAGNFGGGAWDFDGRYLRLTWIQNRPNETLEMRSDGTFFRLCPEGSFTLRRI